MARSNSRVPPRGRRGAAVAALAVVAAVLTAPPVQGAVPDGAAGGYTTVIVELASPPALAAVTPGPQAAGPDWAPAVHRARNLDLAQQAVAAQAEAAGVDLTVTHRLTAAYNGFVAQLPADQVDALADLPGVRAVHPDRTVTVSLHDSVPLVGAPEVWDPPHGGAGSTGAGVTVAVIDTGIDYTHPDLGGGFGPGHKVVAGYDVVNDDPDPMDDHGHGTHVAGIVAADGQVRGVAPDATLTAYKVLDSFGNGQVSDILAGLDRAVHPDNPHRADVVNLSLSGAGDGTDPLSVAAQQAAAAGVVVVAAAGNDGPFPGTVRAPAAAEDVVAVGASASGVRVPRARMVHPVEEDLQAVRFDFSANPSPHPVELDVVDVGRGLPGTYDDVDVAGRAVLMEVADPLVQAGHAQERGAAAVLFYVPDFWGSTGDGGGPVVGPGTGLPGVDRAAVIERDDFPTGIHDADEDRLDLVALQIPGSAAAELQRHVPHGPVRIEISGVDATDLMADFSSRGPTGRFGAKPNLVAPGVEILSTLPGGGYGRASGTSMAAPHVAGAAALLLSLRPELTGPDVAALLSTTARRLDGPDPLEQGAGRLDIPAAAAVARLVGTGTTRPVVVADPPAVSLGLADHAADPLAATGSLTLRNLGAGQVELELAAAGIDPAVGTATVTPDRVTLDGGDEVEVQVRVEATDAAADVDLTGWVTVRVGSSYDLSVPFLLAVRHLHVHVTPDPAPVDGPTRVYVRGPATLAGPPRLAVECPGTSPQEPPVTPTAGGEWQAEVRTGTPGVCQVRVVATADAGRGERLVTGGGGFEVAVPEPIDRAPVRWQPVGPHGEAGWLAFSDDQKRMAVVSNRWPAVFTSGDRGRTWRESRTMPLGDGMPVAVEVHPHDGDTMVVAVNGVGLLEVVDPTYLGRLLRTTDGGASWDILPGRDAVINQIALAPDGEVLAVADEIGLRLTHDLGATWTDVPGPWSGVQDLHWIGDDLYVASFEGLVRVPDAATVADGATPEREVLFRPGVRGWANQVVGDDRTLLVAAYPTPWLYRSDDGGETFTLVLEATGISFLRLGLDGDTVYALQPSLNGVGGLWVSPDRGNTWQVWGDPVDAAVEFDVGWWPNPHPSLRDTRYVSSAGAGVYAVRAPGEFERIGIPAADVFSLALTDGKDGPALVAGTMRDTFRTPIDRGAAVHPDDFEWQSSGGEGTQTDWAGFLATSPSDPSVVYKVLDRGSVLAIYRSDDGGNTWDLVAETDGRPLSLLVHPADPDLVLVGYWTLVEAGFVESRDGGATWRKRMHGQFFEALAGHPTDPDRIWAGGPDGLFLSTDGGRSFAQIADVRVTAIAVDPADPDRLVVGGRALYTSDDGGVTLRRADHMDLPLWISDLEFAPGGSGRVFAASTQFFDEIGVVKGGRGVLVSHDRGASWEPFNQGLRNRNVTSLAVTDDGRWLYAGTLGGSVHRIMLKAGGPPAPPPGPPGPPGVPRPPVPPHGGGAAATLW